MIILTEAAAEKIKSLFEKDEKGEFKYPQYKDVPEDSRNFRIKVRGGGCSGFQYDLSFDKVKPGDQVTEVNGVKLICDPKSFLYLNGSTIDYVEGLMGAGFQVTNPNAKGTCGCGQSFNA